MSCFRAGHTFLVRLRSPLSMLLSVPGRAEVSFLITLVTYFYYIYFMPLVEFNTKTFNSSVILATEAAQRHARIMYSLKNLSKIPALTDKEKIAIYKMLLDE